MFPKQSMSTGKTWQTHGSGSRLHMKTRSSSYSYLCFRAHHLFIHWNHIQFHFYKQEESQKLVISVISSKYITKLLMMIWTCFISQEVDVDLQTGVEPCSHLRPVQRNPQWRTGLVVAALMLNWSMCQAVNVLQVLLISRPYFADAENRAHPRPSVTWLTTVRPVANEPPGAHTRSFIPHQKCAREILMTTFQSFRNVMVWKKMV